MSKSVFPHLDQHGQANMVDIGDKPSTRRRAVAEAKLIMRPETVEMIRQDQLRKGDALAVARIAGLSAVKKTPDLLPLAHPLAVTHASIQFELETSAVGIRATVETTGPTGVEMEAMTAATVAALNVYDMIKGHDRGAELAQVRLLEKSGGRSGHYVAL